MWKLSLRKAGKTCSESLVRKGQGWNAGLTPDHYAVKSPAGQAICQAVKKRLLPVFKLVPSFVDETIKL